MTSSYLIDAEFTAAIHREAARQRHADPHPNAYILMTELNAEIGILAAQIRSPATPLPGTITREFTLSVRIAALCMRMALDTPGTGT